MSKNIIIQKAGISQSLTVNALRLKKQDGGTEDWVPEDECAVASISVTKNGTYIADERNLYGFDAVTVNVSADSVTGYINGVKYIVSLDANGYLVFTRVD